MKFHRIIDISHKTFLWFGKMICLRKQCYFCQKKVNEKELIEVDNKFDGFDSETHEFILDELPKIQQKEPKNIIQYRHQIQKRKNRAHKQIQKGRKSDYITKIYLHRCKYGYDVLNICQNCFNAAKKRFEIQE